MVPPPPPLPHTMSEGGHEEATKSQLSEAEQAAGGRGSAAASPVGRPRPVGRKQSRRREKIKRWHLAKRGEASLSCPRAVRTMSAPRRPLLSRCAVMHVRSVCSPSERHVRSCPASHASGSLDTTSVLNATWKYPSITAPARLFCTLRWTLPFWFH